MSGLFGGTSGGIDTGGTASPSGSIIPLGTISQGGGIPGTGIIPVASGTSHGSPAAGTSGGLLSRPTGQINVQVNPNGPFYVQSPSVVTARGNYYSPPALPPASLPIQVTVNRGGFIQPTYRR